MIDGILFDKDGTLFDFRISWGRWASEFLGGIAQDNEHADRLGGAIGFDPATGQFSPGSPVIAATATDIARALLPHLPGQSLVPLTELIDDAAARTTMAETVPLRPFLAGLRALGLKLGVATNDSEAPARAHLAAHDITGFFDFIAGHDSGYGAKPAPGMCHGFAHCVAADPSRLVMVGDSLHDMDAGRAAGMRTVAVLTGVASRDDLAPHADVVLDDIGQIPGWLRSL